MGKADLVQVVWTDWLDFEGQNFGWDLNGVLYLYGSDDQAFYIGETYRGSPWERLKSHETDGVLECVLQRSGGAFGVKVGELILPTGRRISKELLYDIQTLLIYQESGAGSCRCNSSSTKSRDTRRDGMVVINQGNYSPLAQRYDDDGT